MKVESRIKFVSREKDTDRHNYIVLWFDEPATLAHSNGQIEFVTEASLPEVRAMDLDMFLALFGFTIEPGKLFPVELSVTVPDKKPERKPVTGFTNKR